jgi:hypothetical protein
MLFWLKVLRVPSMLYWHHCFWACDKALHHGVRWNKTTHLIDGVRKTILSIKEFTALCFHAEITTYSTPNSKCSISQLGAGCALKFDQS